MIFFGVYLVGGRLNCSEIIQVLEYVGLCLSLI